MLFFILLDKGFLNNFVDDIEVLDFFFLGVLYEIKIIPVLISLLGKTAHLTFHCRIKLMLKYFRTSDTLFHLWILEWQENSEEARLKSFGPLVDNRHDTGVWDYSEKGKSIQSQRRWEQKKGKMWARCSWGQNGIWSQMTWQRDKRSLTMLYEILRVFNV